jgi:HK97 family phage major capsid protein
MSLEEITAQVGALNTAWTEFKRVNDDRLLEIEKKGSSDVLFQPHLEKINKAIDDSKTRLDEIETAVKRPGNGGDSKDGNKGDSKEQKEYNSAFKNYLRKGNESNLGELQAKAVSMLVGSEPDGGYFVTPQMSSQIITKVFETSPIRALATVETIGTDSLDIMTDFNQITSGWTGEASTRSQTNTPAVGKKQIIAHEIYANLQATQKLLDDANVDIESWLSGKAADNFARTENTAFVSGTGVAQPRGFTTYPSGTTIGTQIEQVGSGNAGAFSFDGLIGLQAALKEPYQNGAAFLMTRTSVGLVRKLKDGQGHYIWQPNAQAGQPDSLLGKPVYMAADMAEAAAASLSAAYGNFKAGYTIVDRVGIRTLRDPFTNKPFVIFYVTKRVGGDVTNSEALKLQILS